MGLNFIPKVSSNEDGALTHNYTSNSPETE